MEITKEQFDNAYNQHLPNWFIKFVYRYFSASTEKKDFEIHDIVAYVLLGLFAVGFLGTVFNFSKHFIAPFLYAYTTIVVIIVLGLVIAITLNKLRIVKICKLLGITVDVYNGLADEYYPEE